MSWNSKVKLISIPEFMIGNGHQIEFKTKEEQQTFFESHAIGEYSWNDMSYVRSNGGNMKILANKDALDAKAPNWIMFQNTDFGERWFFANILDMYYISPKVTDITYAVDSFQTFMFDINLSNFSYISRRTWSGKNDDENELMQLPLEDIDIGNDFVVCDNVFDFNDTDGNYETEQFYYILMTEKLLESGSSHSITTPEHTGNYLEGNALKSKTFKNGENQVLFGYVVNFAFLNACLEQGVFQKQCVIVSALQLIMQLPFGRSLFRTGLVNQKENIRKDVTVSLPAEAEIYDQKNFGLMNKEVKIPNWSSTLCDYINKCIANDFSRPYDDTVPTGAIGKYLFRYPYSLLETYDFYNQPDTLRIENLNRLNQFEYIRSKMLPVFKYASIGQNPMLVYSVKGYKNNGVSKEINDLLTVDNISSFASDNMNTVQSTLSLPIITDYLASFLQANMNQINAQRANLKDSLATQLNNAGASMQAQATAIALSQRNALISAHTQAVNSNLQTNASLQAQLSSINLQKDVSDRNAGNAYQQAMNQAALQGVLGGIQAAGGAVSAFVNPMAGIGTAFGGLSQIANAGLQATNAGLQKTTQNINAAQTQAVATQNAQMMASAQQAATGNTLAAGVQMAENNARAANAQAQVSYANAIRSSTTAYQNEIRSLNARIEDAKNIPASVQSMGNNGSIFNTMFNRNMIRFTTKALPKGVMQRLIWYFVNSGFLTNKMEKLEDVKNKFSDAPGYFVQTVNANVSGVVPLEHLRQIRDMYNSGVYIWKPEKYLDFDGMRTV